MDNIDITPDTELVIIDDAVAVDVESEDSFGKEIAKTLVISTATSAGTVAGFIVIGLAVSKFSEIRAKRRIAKTDKPVVEVPVAETTDTPQTPEN